MLAVLLVIVPLIAAPVVALLGLRTGRAVGIAVAILHLLVSLATLRSWFAGGPRTSVLLGDWPRWVAIRLEVDGLSAAMLVVTGILFLATWLARLGEAAADSEPEAKPQAPDGVLLALLGACSGAYFARDLFHLFVWFEVGMVASFAAIAIESGARGGEAWRAYFSVSVFSSLLFLLGIALTVGRAGGLDFSQIAGAARAGADDPAWSFAFAALAGGLLLKSAVAPVGVVLGQTYPLLRWSTAGLFGGLLTKVGVYGLIRLSCELMPVQAEQGAWVIVALACATMLYGVLGAASANDAGEILSFHVVSQVGYLLLGIGIGGRVAIAAAIFYTLHHMVVKTGLYFACGAGEQVIGRRKVGAGPGVASHDAAATIAFVGLALSLAGIPLLSGFWAKFALLRASVVEAEWIGFWFAVVVGALTLYSMVKLWLGMFATGSPASDPAPARLPRKAARMIVAAALLLASVSVWIGLSPGPLWELSERAADELLTPHPEPAP